MPLADEVFFPEKLQQNEAGKGKFEVWGGVTHSANPSIWEARLGYTASLKPAWAG